MMYQFLIVFEISPENTKVFSAISDDVALCEQIRSCHRQYGNTVQTPDHIQEFISNIDTWATLIYSDEGEEDMKNFKDPVKLMGLGLNVELIHTGFIL